MKNLALLVFLVGYVGMMCTAQNSNRTVGITGVYFLPISSDPMLYNHDDAFAGGLFYDYCKPNGIKLSAGVNYYSSSFYNWHYDGNPQNGIIRFTGKSEYLTFPLTASYNCLKGASTQWQAFINVGYVLFLHQNTKTNYIHSKDTAYPATGITRERFITNYLTLGVSARYLLGDKIYLGFGTTHYQFFRVNGRKATGFPSLSIEVLVGFKL